MRLFQRRRPSARADRWANFARDLELEESSELTGRLRDQLDLGSGELDPVYALRRSGQPQLILFDQLRERSGPTGAVSRLRTCALMRTVAGGQGVSWRASARRNRVVESLEASRTGASRLEFDTDRDFDARVSVFARDADEVRSLLSPTVRVALLRLLEPFDGEWQAGTQPVHPSDLPTSTALSANLVVGAGSLLLWAEPDEPLPFERLIELVTGMFTLYASLAAAESA